MQTSGDLVAEVGIQAWEEEVILSRALFLIGLLVIPAAIGSSAQCLAEKLLWSFQSTGLF
jgi:hypothetical protein